MMTKVAQYVIVVGTALTVAVAGCTCGNGGGVKGTEQPAVPEGGGTAATGESISAGSAMGRRGAAGMKAYVDPATGELTDRPAPGTPPLPGDVIVPHGTPRDSSVPGGGRLIGPGNDEAR